MEHIEEAGVHSGDYVAAASASLSQMKIRWRSTKRQKLHEAFARALKVSVSMNISSP